MIAPYNLSIFKKKRKVFLWGTAFFLLFVFIFTTPFDTSKSVERFPKDKSLDKYEMSEKIAKGNIWRRFALFALGLYSLISLFHRKVNELQINKMLGWLILFFLLWASLSIIWGQETWLTLRRVIILLVLAFSAFNIAKRMSLREVVLLTIIISGITLLISVVTEIYLGTFQNFSENWRFAGIIHPVAQGWNCGLLTIAALAMSKNDKKKSSVYLGLSLVAFLFLVLTKSRLAFLATLVGIGTCWSLSSPKSTKVVFLFVFSVMVYICTMYYILWGGITGTLETALSFRRGEEGKTSISSLTGRISLWEESLTYAKERPILGYGYNAFFNQRNSVLIAEAVGWNPGSSHNGYIEILLGLGLIGVCSFVLILFMALKTSIKLSKINSAYAFVAAIIGWLCVNLILETLLITRPIFPNFLIMILIAKLGFVKSNEENTEYRTEE